MSLHPYANELNTLERRRKVLERLVLLSRQLLAASGGMSALEDCLQNNDALPERRRQQILRMAEPYHDQPEPRLLKKLADTEDQLRQRLHLLFTLAGDLSASQQHSALDIGHSELELTDFLKDVLISMAIRWVLSQRGVAISALHLPVSPGDLGARLLRTRTQESRCKVRVREQAQTMREELQQFIQKPDVPDDLRQQANQALERLDNSLWQWQQGAPMSTLTHCLESLSFDSETGIQCQPLVQTDPLPAAADTTPTSAVENAEPARQERATTGFALKHSPPDNGFLTRLQIWFNSPWTVTWADTRHMPASRQFMQ